MQICSLYQNKLLQTETREAGCFLKTKKANEKPTPGRGQAGAAEKQ